MEPSPSSDASRGSLLTIESRSQNAALEITAAVLEVCEGARPLAAARSSFPGRFWRDMDLWGSALRVPASVAIDLASRSGEAPETRQSVPS